MLWPSLPSSPKPAVFEPPDAVPVSSSSVVTDSAIIGQPFALITCWPRREDDVSVALTPTPTPYLEPSAPLPSGVREVEPGNGRTSTS